MFRFQILSTPTFGINRFPANRRRVGEFPHQDQRQSRCACASDPTKRHGPYFELTYKANGKTVNVKLSPEAAPLYKAAAQQYRKLKTLLNRLDKLSKTILRHQAKQAESKRQN